MYEERTTRRGGLEADDQAFVTQLARLCDGIPGPTLPIRQATFYALLRALGVLSPRDLAATLSSIANGNAARIAELADGVDLAAAAAGLIRQADRLLGEAGGRQAPYRQTAQAYEALRDRVRRLIERAALPGLGKCGVCTYTTLAGRRYLSQAPDCPTHGLRTSPVPSTLM